MKNMKQLENMKCFVQQEVIADIGRNRANGKK